MAVRILYLLISLCAAAGLLLQSGLIRGRPRKHFFVYYTNLSNALTGIFYFLAGLMPSKNGFYTFLLSPTVHFSVTLMILITFIIYHFILAPEYRKRGQKYEDNINTIGNFIVHYAVPIGAFLLWVFFSDKGITVMSCVYWLILPLSYMFFILLRARGGVFIGNTDSCYPYSFMDVEKLGLKKSIRNFTILFIAFFLLALILFAAVKFTMLF